MTIGFGNYNYFLGLLVLLFNKIWEIRMLVLSTFVSKENSFLGLHVCLEVNLEIPNFLFDDYFFTNDWKFQSNKNEPKKNENLRRKEMILYTCQFTNGFLIHIVEEKK